MATNVTLDPFDPRFANDRFGTYAQLRDDAPVAVTSANEHDSFVITRYEDVERIFKDPTNRVQPKAGVFPDHIGSGAGADFYRYSLPEMDAPAHTRLRKLASPAFAPRSVAAMSGWVEDLIVAGLDRLGDVESGSIVDFVHNFGMTVPAEIACRLLHAPMSDAGTVLNNMPALNPLLSQSNMTPGQLADANAAAAFYFDYIGNLVDSLQGTLPEDDAVGALLGAEADGSKLSRQELVITLVGFFIASYHTTMTVMTSAIFALLTNPDQRALLAADPDLAPKAWEEVLRFYSPVHFIQRYAGSDLELQGERIPEGSHLMLGIASANRDPRRFVDPDRFNIEREDNRHLAFTAGGHYCIGAPLSRLEGNILLRELPKRLPNLELVQQHPAWTPDLSFVGIMGLEVAPNGR